MRPSRILSFLSLFAAATLLRLPAAEVAFDWFEYTGQTSESTSRTSPSEFQNPILTGFYPDPSICQAGDDYYLINSTFAYYPGIPIFQSRDLVNWKQIGHVIDRPRQLPYDRLGVSRGLFAPAISHHQGTFYVVCTMADAGGNFVVTATNPAGPWSDPTWLDFEGIDPSLFFDDDGRAWMLNNGAPEGAPLYPGHRAIWIQQFAPGARRMIGPRKVLVNGGVDIKQKPVWIEGPHIYKRDGWYYLCCAEGGTSVNHSQVILRSREVDGPYAPWEQNPILTQRDLDGNATSAVTSTGHADLVIGPDHQWWAVFLGVRPYEGRFSPMGRETFLLPVSWTNDGWPRILGQGQRVPLTAKAPIGTTVKESPEHLNGDFTWRDEFTSSALSSLWIMLRSPAETWWKPNDAGRLLLTARAEPLAGQGNPSFLGRRVQHARFSASTSVELPSEPGISAGLALFQGERFHYFLAAKRDAGQVVISLERANRSAPEVIASVRLESAGKVELRAEANNATCSFSYALQPGAWQTLVTDADAKLLTTDVAGGFVGATVGPHARVDRSPKPSDPNSGTAPSEKTTFVIVHGATAGGWEWKQAGQFLTDDGHTVHRVTLTGLGERMHLNSPAVDLETHINDVVNTILFEDLHDVVLTGHSYGGMVITGVMDRIPERLRQVIFLDAAVPDDGMSIWQLLGSGPQDPSRFVDGFMQVPWVKPDAKPPHSVKHSIKCFSQPVSYKTPAALALPVTYVAFVPKGQSIEERAAKDPSWKRAAARGWTIRTFPGGHVAHQEDPRGVATLMEKAINDHNRALVGQPAAALASR